MWSNTANTQYRVNHVLGRFCPWEDFIPGRIQSFALSLHYGKHSSRSSLVFFVIFCRGGDFVPTRTLPSPMYIITVKIHIDQVLYFWGFGPGVILSRLKFYLLFMWSNTANTQYKANHVLGRFCPWEDFIPGRIQSLALSLHYGNHSLRSSFVFFWTFCRGGILSQQELYLILCISLQ